MSAEQAYLEEQLALQEQLTTFYVGSEMYGINVNRVQEVSGPMKLFHVPRAPQFVKGLVNLRGQIATAISLSQIFLKNSGQESDKMSIVCRIEGSLISLIVDSIGDVVVVESDAFERTPDTIPSHLKKYVSGIYKLNGKILSVLDIDLLLKELIQHNETTKRN